MAAILSRPPTNSVPHVLLHHATRPLGHHWHTVNLYMKNETSIASTYKSCDLLLTSLPKNVSRFLCNSSSGDAKPKRRLARPSLWFLWCCCRRPAALDILCQQRQPPRRHLLASQSQAMQDEHGSNLSIGGEQTSVRFFTIDWTCLPGIAFHFFLYLRTDELNLLQHQTVEAQIALPRTDSQALSLAQKVRHWQ